MSKVLSGRNCRESHALRHNLATGAVGRLTTTIAISIKKQSVTSVERKDTSRLFVDQRKRLTHVNCNGKMYDSTDSRRNLHATTNTESDPESLPLHTIGGGATPQ